MPNKQSCGVGNEYEKHQMLCSFATVFVTGVRLVQHLFSPLASGRFFSPSYFMEVFSSALPQHPPGIIDRCYNFTKFVSESLHGCFKVNEPPQGC